MTNQEIEKFIAKNINRHLSNKVLHAHPSPAYWAADFNYKDIEQALLTSHASSTDVNMYVGIPYCLPTKPSHCGFCLFPTEKYSGANDISDYLNFIDKEAALYKPYYQNATIKSLYIGGGTPNLLAQKDYFRLMDIIEKLFPGMDNGIEKTLEGIPQLFNEEKIRAISESGFNRVSMGVQQVNDRLIKHSGRKQTRKQVFDAIDYFHKYNLACNIDLIYAWPEQTIDDMLNDLREITESGIKHITHYELNIAGRSDFATKKRKLVPDMNGKLEMYHVAREFLLSQGYRQRTVYDWEKPESDSVNNIKNGLEEYHYENNLRHFFPAENTTQTSSMCGLGFAAVNIRIQPLQLKTPSVSVMNCKNLVQYFGYIMSGKLPVERAFVHTSEDVRLIWLFQSLQEMNIDINRYSTLFDRSLTNDYKSIWHALEDKQWLKVTENKINIIGDGEFYVPLIQSLISKERVDKITSRKVLMQKTI